MRGAPACLGVVAAIAGGGCGRLDFDPVATTRGDARADAAPLGTWGPPIPLPGIDAVDDPSVTADGLELYVNKGTQVEVAIRATTADPWPTPVMVVLPGPLYSPDISADGLTLWGASATANVDLVFTTRASRTSPWGPFTAVPELASAGTDDGPSLSSDELMIVFDSDRGLAQPDLFTSTRPAVGAPWSPPVPIAELNTPMGEARPDISDDKRTIYYQRGADLAVAHRDDPGGAFDSMRLLTELNTTSIDNDPWISADERRLVFASDRGGTTLQMYEATR